MTVEDLERQIMTALLAGDDPLLETLRGQYAVAVVKDRERTGTGFVTRFRGAGERRTDRAQAAAPR